MDRGEMGEPGTLIKFGLQAHLLQLQDEGLLYLNLPQYFWEVEDEELRGDPFDCIAEVARGPRIGFTLADGREISMEGEWILRMYPPEPEEINIFCMYALRPLLEGTFPVDEKNFRFGDHALLLINRDEFMRRIESTLKSQRIRAEANLVEYVDNKYTGKLGPFRKLKRFAYRSEWRLACSNGPGKPREIRIGSIGDISVIMRSDEVNKTIRVDFEQDGAPDR
jgi:hypothetical protein